MSVRTCQYHPVAYILYLIPSRQDLFEYSCYCVMPPHKPSWELAMPPDQPIWRNHAGQTCRGLFFSTLVALVDPGKQTHTPLCIFKFIFITFIHESQYTICLTLVTIGHELTKLRRTHLVTKKTNGLIYRSDGAGERYIDLHFSSAGSPRPPIHPPWLGKHALSAWFPGWDAGPFPPRRALHRFLGSQLFAVQVSRPRRHHSQPGIPSDNHYLNYINYPYTLFSYKFIYIYIYICKR